jgi:hypothetical protein
MMFKWVNGPHAAVLYARGKWHLQIAVEPTASRPIVAVALQASAG